MLILGIETSFDETCAAILRITEQKNRRLKIAVLANIISSQILKHKKFGGVVPQLAAKLHQKNFIPVLEKAIRVAKVKPQKIDLISVASGPGIIPALLVGVTIAKTLAWGLGKPLIGVNHMEGHVLSVFLDKKYPISNIQYPILALLVSGGHTQMVLMEKWLKYKMLGETRDDAAGEAFDKVGKLFGLDYPAGAKIERLAKKGNPEAFNFPRPMIKSKNYDFSFSGLKTAVKNTIESLRKERKLSRRTIGDIAASFQQAVIDVLVLKTIQAGQEFCVKSLIIGGGVSANQALCNNLKKFLKEDLPDVVFLVPQKEYTNDNAAMISLAGYFRYKIGESGDWKKVQADANLKLDG